MEWLIWGGAGLMVVLLVLVESIRFGPNSLSQAELERRAEKGDPDAKSELSKRRLLPLYYGLMRLKVTFLVVGLVGVLAVLYPLWLALVSSLGLLLLVGLAVAQGWLNWLARWIQKLYERHVWKLVQAGAPVFKLFAPRGNGGGEISFASKEELKQMVERDAAILDPNEKTRLIAAMHLNGKTVSDAMVPANNIATVGQSETVGPLLLDKLHKTGHNIIVVVARGLDSVKGLLYMSDLVPLHPDIKTVKDAMRTKVFWLPAEAPLSAVLSASLKTGRQLFLVSDKGKTVGLITLADALEQTLGSRTSKDDHLSTKPDAD